MDAGNGPESNKSIFVKSGENTAPVSKNQGFSCHEGIEIVENCEEIRLKNNIFDNVLLKTIFFAILQPFWVVLAHFWAILGHLWSILGVPKQVPNQTSRLETQLLGPKRVQEGLQGRFSIDLGRISADLGCFGNDF